jgi:hypothetical protein
MSTTYEVSFEPLTLGGSNYDSWSAHVLNEIRTFGPHAEQVVVASILPPLTRVDNFDLSNLSIEELECWQLNAQVTNYIRSTLSCDVQEMICDDIIDAHDIWEIFQDLYDVPKCDDQDQRASMKSEASDVDHSYSCAHDDISVESDEKREINGQNEELGFELDKPSTSEDQGKNVPSEECSTSEAYTDLLVTTTKDQQDNKSKSGDPVGKPVQPVSKTGLTGFHRMNTTKSNKCSRRRSRKAPTVSRSSTLSVDDHKCLMAKKSKETKDNQMAKRVEDQVDTIKSLTQKIEAFKLSHSTLVNKYDILLNKDACATNSSTCVASLEQEKKVLNEKLEKLTSEPMALQARHKELDCSHDMVVESYTCLEVAHEVVLSSIKSTQPLSHTCMLTC